MKYKNIYTSKSIDYNCGKLFGPIGFAKDYVFTENKKGMQCILPIKDDSIEEHYYLAEINSFDFFNDVIKYGKQFYKVLNDCITPIKMSYRPPQTFEESCINIVSEENIKLHLEELKPICYGFVKEYGTPVVFQRFYPVSYKMHYGFPISFIINQTLFIYIIFTVFSKLSSGYNNYLKIYNSLLINKKLEDEEILNKITEYINIYSMPTYHFSSFNMEILKQGSYILPITITPNLFTFAFEALQYNIATMSFFEALDDGNSEFMMFRKCSRCFKNITDTIEVEDFIKMPKMKHVHCDECKKEIRRITNNKYEHSIREIYDILKANINECPMKLAAQIKTLPPKDKVRKKDLVKLYEQYEQYKNDSH